MDNNVIKILKKGINVSILSNVLIVVFNFFFSLLLFDDIKIILLSFFIKKLLIIILLFICILLSVAFFTLAERKIMGFMQRRRGPNVVGIHGLFQPLADGVKLILKETILPLKANQFIFNLAPVITFFLSLVSWSIIPFGNKYVYADINLGVFFLFAISSLSVYGIICAGWSSNSKYPLLGALRSAAQMISYEVSFALILLTLLGYTESLNLVHIANFQANFWFVNGLWISLILFFISILAETNRPPFDLPEAEAELVSGYNVEYAALTFALFFLAEYSNMILMGAFASILFFGGGSLISFTLKILFFLFSFVWVRAAFPRLRYDQLMSLGWKIILPLSLGFFLVIQYFLIVF